MRMAVLPLLTNEEMKPPVALLLYAPDAPASAVYYPVHQLLAGVAGAALCADAQHSRALHRSAAGNPAGASVPDEWPREAQPARPRPPLTRRRSLPAADAIGEACSRANVCRAARDDPLALLAEAAGYADHELVVGAAGRAARRTPATSSRASWRR